MALVYIFSVLILVQFYFLFRFYFPFVFRKVHTEKTVNLPPVSVIISARNEAVNLRKNLPRILEQDYPEFEIVVINDYSGDETFDLLLNWKMKEPKLKVVNVGEQKPKFSGKKFALTLGIKAASHERLLFTDADCIPSSKDWIKETMMVLSGEQNIILGYGPMTSKKGFLNAMIRFETVETALNYFSFAQQGSTYMGVGRNLSYHRKLFFDNKGFVNHQDIKSGDDDLFINEVATKRNVNLSLSQNAFMYSDAPDTWKKWWNQKQRHYSTAKRYKGSHKIHLFLLSTTNLLIYIALILSLSLWVYPIIIGGTFLVRFLLQFIVHQRAYKIFKEKNLIPWFLFLEIFYLGFLAFQAPSMLRKKRVKWK